MGQESGRGVVAPRERGTLVDEMERRFGPGAVADWDGSGEVAIVGATTTGPDGSAGREALAARCEAQADAMSEAGWHVTANLLGAGAALLRGSQVAEVSPVGGTLDDLRRRWALHAVRRREDHPAAADALEALAARVDLG